MFNSVALDIVIGLVFIYLLFSLLTTIIQEIISTHFAFRAKFLEKAVRRMLDDGIEKKLFWKTQSKETTNPEESPVSKVFYDHPLIKYLGEEPQTSKPSYIKNTTFSKVVIDLLRGKDAAIGSDTKQRIEAALKTGMTEWEKTKINTETISYLRSVWVDAEGDVEKFKLQIENWFDETMDRAAGWYKKYIQVVLFIIGFTIAVLFNVDTIKIVNALAKDPKLREQIIQQASTFTAAHPNLEKELEEDKINNQKIFDQIQKKNISEKDSVLRAEKKDSLDAASLENYKANKNLRDTLITRATSLVNNDLNDVKSVLGLGLNSYDCQRCDLKCFFRSLGGWFITALALSLGAPFWFDLLNKLMKMRSSTQAASAKKEDKKE